MKLYYTFIVLVLAFGIMGCNQPVQEEKKCMQLSEKCGLTSDCCEGLICISGACSQYSCRAKDEACAVDSDCCEWFFCKNHICEQRKGCLYDNPSCGSDSVCINNICVKKEGCEYNNPPCSVGYFTCKNNWCQLPYLSYSYNVTIKKGLDLVYTNFSYFQTNGYNKTDGIMTFAYTTQNEPPYKNPNLNFIIDIRIDSISGQCTSVSYFEKHIGHYLNGFNCSDFNKLLDINTRYRDKVNGFTKYKKEMIRVPAGEYEADKFNKGTETYWFVDNLPVPVKFISKNPVPFNIENPYYDSATYELVYYRNYG